MAIKSTVYKFQLQIADLDRHYYADHALTLARHPSETDQRLVARVLAFARCAGDGFDMTGAVCTPDEPDLCQRTLDGRIARWIEVGQPDARRLLKAAGRAERVTVHPDGGAAARMWWTGVERDLARLRKLEVIAFPDDAVKALSVHLARTTAWQITVQDRVLMVSGAEDCVSVETEVWRAIG